MSPVRPNLLAGLAGLLLIAASCSSSGGSPAPGSETPAETPGDPTPTTSLEATPDTEPSGAEPSGSEPSGAVASLPAGAIAIVTFGDSLTEGDCDESSRGYPGRLLPLVQKARPGSTILNVGHSGWTSGDLANTANDPPTEIARAIDSRPDLALVWIGSNDLWALYEYGPEPMTAGAEQDDLVAYEANLETVLGRLSDKGTAIWIALLDDQSKRPAVAAPAGEPAFPNTTAADRQRMSAHVTAYNEIIRRVAGKYGAATVDFHNTTIFTSAATLCGDGNHPNDTGYDAITETWWAALQPALG